MMKRCFSCFTTYGDDFSICPRCGQMENNAPLEPIHLLPGTVLGGRYILGQAVGSGGFGIVYKAFDMKFETIIAVKEFFMTRLITRASGQKEVIVARKSQEEFQYRKKRFLAEARTMAKFGSHRSIPNVFDFFEENNTAYIVMEFLEGITLSEYLKQNNYPVNQDFALMIVNEICIALKSLHEERVIHQDVAPDNIYICSGKNIRLKLMDLGAAKLADSTDSVVDIILKPGYSPVEQYDNIKNIGPWTDIYALGATLYVMLTGVKPEEATNRREHDIVVPPNVLNSSISENLSNAIMKAMAVERHMRFKNVNEFLNAINGDKKVMSLDKERRQRKRKKLLSIAMAFALVVASVSFGYKIFSEKKAEESLNPSEISVWFSVSEDSSEEEAMQAVKSDFESKFQGVKIELMAFPEQKYATELEKAAKNDELPTLFESSGASDNVLDKAKDLKNVIASKQFETAMFMDQYKTYYKEQKKLPLAIEVPIAFVITNGSESIEYKERVFTELSDFKYDKISVDSRHSDIVKKNFKDFKSNYNEKHFLNNENNKSAIMLSSTLVINEVREKLTFYEKSYVYPDTEEIGCNFTYEWSIGRGSEDQIRAGEKLLTWMLGNAYQSYLMVTKCNDGQIPINPICFKTKIESQYMSPIEDLYENFVF